METAQTHRVRGFVVLFAALLSLVLWAGCRPAKVTGVEDDITTTNTYNSLGYQRHTDKNGLVTYNYLMAENQIAIKQYPGGKKVFSNIAIFLEDKTHFSAVYEESVGCTRAVYKVHHSIVNQTWSASKHIVTFNKIGTAQLNSFNGGGTLDLQFDRNLNTAGLGGKHSTISYGQSSMGEDQVKNTGTLYSIKDGLNMLDTSTDCGH